MSASSDLRYLRHRIRSESKFMKQEVNHQNSLERRFYRLFTGYSCTDMACFAAKARFDNLAHRVKRAFAAKQATLVCE